MTTSPAPAGGPPPSAVVDLAEKLSALSDHWSPKDLSSRAGEGGRAHAFTLR